MGQVYFCEGGGRVKSNPAYLTDSDREGLRVEIVLQLVLQLAQVLLLRALRIIGTLIIKPL